MTRSRNLLKIQAAARSSEVREKVLDALDSIPETLEQADIFIEIYRSRSDKRLAQKAVALYVAILAALEHMIEWLDENVFSETLFL